MTQLATRIAQGFTLLWMVAVPYSTAVAEISLGIALASLLVAAWRGEVRPWQELSPWAKRVLILWAAFFGWILLTHFFALDRPLAMANLKKMYRFFGLLPLVILPWDRRFRIALYTSLTVLAVTMALEALPPYFRGSVGRIEAGRLHYNTLSQFAAAISLVLSVAAIGEDRVRRDWRVMWGVGAIIGVTMLVCTLSRLAWAAWFSALPMIGLIAVPRRRRWIFLVVMVVVGVTAFSVPQVRERARRFTEFSDPEFARRYDMWAMGEQLVRERPLVGVGPSGVALRYDELKSGALVDDDRRWIHLHNDLINIAAYHGIPASLIWITLAGFLYVLMVRWIFTPRAKGPPPLALGAALSIHVFFICGMLHDTLPIYRKFAWYLLLWGMLIHASTRKALEEPR